MAARCHDQARIAADQLFGGAAAPSPENVEEFLMACHRRIDQRLAAMERAAAALDSNREEALAALEAALQFLDTSGALHTEDEEESVFPRLRARMEPGERTFLAGLEHDHAEAGMIHGRLRQLAAKASQGLEHDGELRGAVQELAALYHRHIENEDATLTGYARALLTPRERQAVAEEMRGRRMRAAHTNSADRTPENRP
ncbi:MAG: hemerythrin domain-containing protein [Bryobacteraceae bacterium]